MKAEIEQHMPALLCNVNGAGEKKGGGDKKVKRSNSKALQARALYSSKGISV